MIINPGILALAVLKDLFMLTRRLLLSAALALSLWAVPAWAAPKKAQLSAQDLADIQRAEEILNAITTLKARFLQISANSGQADGTVYLSRPGRLRLQYNPPSPLLVVADGRFLIVHDKELGAPSYLPLDSTPAGILVRDKLQLNGKDLSVSRIQRGSGILTITVFQNDEPGQGELALVFSESPLTLRQWRIIDPQGSVTAVSLYETQTDLKLDPGLFQFKDPNFAKPALRND